jgi:hypothetical protein
MYLTNRNPNGNIKFGVGGVHGAASEKMTLTSTGDLGIGTNSPVSNFHVNKYNSTSSVPALGNAGLNASIGAYSFGTQFGTLSGGQGYIQQTRADGSSTSYDLYLQPRGGNVGIGTDTPSSKLDVNGNIRIDSGNGGVGTLNVYGSNQSTGRVYVGQSDSYGGGIEYNGNGIPVTTGAGRDYITLWRRENNNDQWTARNRATNNDWEFRGDVEAFTSSDKRFKDNILNIQNPIDKISKIGGYTFEWNEKSTKEKGKKDIGVIAQEIEKVLPELVTTRDNGYKAVKYDKIVALLIEGMKEQQKEINELKNKIK